LANYERHKLELPSANARGFRRSFVLRSVVQPKASHKRRGRDPLFQSFFANGERTMKPMDRLNLVLMTICLTALTVASIFLFIVVPYLNRPNDGNFTQSEWVHFYMEDTVR